MKKDKQNTIKSVKEIKSKNGTLITELFTDYDIKEIPIVEYIQNFHMKNFLESNVQMKYHSRIGSNAIQMEELFKSLEIEGFKITKQSYILGKLSSIHYSNKGIILTLSRENIDIEISATKDFKFLCLDERKIISYLNNLFEKEKISKEQHSYLVNSVEFMLQYHIKYESKFSSFVNYHVYGLNKPRKFITDYLSLIPLEEMNIPKDIFSKMTSKNYVTEYTQEYDVNNFYSMPAAICTNFVEVKELNGFVIKFKFDSAVYFKSNYKEEEFIDKLDLLNLINIASCRFHDAYSSALTN